MSEEEMLALIGQYLGALGIEGDFLKDELESYQRNPEIGEEFAQWVKAGANTEKFPEAVRYEGHSAKDLAKMVPGGNGSGVYSFMVALKEEPEWARAAIADGFKIK